MKTLGIQFVGRSKNAKEKVYSLYARVTVDGRRTEISLKKKILKTYWNQARGVAKGNLPEALSLNQFLEELRSLIVSKYHELMLNGEHFDVENLKDLVLGKEDEGFSLMKLVDYHEQVMGPVLKQGTMKNYYTTKKYIQTFLRDSQRKEDVLLNKIDYAFLLNFENYLRAHKPTDHQRPLTQNGIMKHMERFKKILNLGSKMDLLEKNPFDKYQFKFNRHDRDYLNEEELNRLETKNIKNPRIELVRDLFVFACYTGLSYIDMASLRKEHLINGPSGNLWIKTQRNKTHTPVKIPLLPKALQVLEKYNEDPRAEVKGLLLPVISNQRLNTYLKEIADICEIEKNLSFHVARHTFATTVTLQNGVPIETVSKMLGHNKITTTQIYARVMEVKLNEDMENLKKRLRSKSKP
ncbi:site-specific integrase [Algoriphagus confluentis]|uniref:Site-specific integrase n=2 Tax=Algoriphagus confluentis TaxID=1697556 RepID=A0ABQ6PVI2_9BACT|nr:site-specific integrase [Algoriphagus confluentis]